MKKITLAIIATITMSLTAQAAQSKQHITIGGNQSTIDSKSGTGYDIAWGVTKVWDNGVMSDIDFNYGSVDIESETFNNFGVDVKLGYKYKRLSIYGMGSAIYQSYHEKEAAGFGFGGGAEVDLFKHLAVGANYQTYSMTSETNDYDYDTVKAYLKIMF
jgi:opacity protein-like surface antigen